MQSAVGSSSSGASVALCPIDGSAGCSLAPAAESPGNLEVDVVPVMTVDELLAMHKLRHADLLNLSRLRYCRTLLTMTAASDYDDQALNLLTAPLMCYSLLQIDAEGAFRVMMIVGLFAALHGCY
jgi:hypothetical protein